MLLAVAALAAGGLAPAAEAATFTVNSTLDAVDRNPGDGLCRTNANTCTLRAAIQEANARTSADAIVVPTGVYAITRGGTSATTGDFDVTAPLTITGAGAGLTILDGGTPPSGSIPERRGLDRLLDLSARAGNVTVSGLTLREGFDATQGGALANLSPGTVRLVDVAILDSYAVAFGGGVYHGGGGRLELAGVVLAGNASGGEGGGLYTWSGAVVVGPGSAPSVLTGNAARNGGGIFSAGVVGSDGRRASVDVVGATLFGNTAALDGGGILNGLEGDLMLTGTTFAENAAGGAGGGVESTSKSSLAISGGSFERNDAAGDGGGVFTHTEGPVSIDGVSFAGNTAGDGGGGLSLDGGGTAVVRGSSFLGNAAAGEGGGLAIHSSGDVAISGGAVKGNRSELNAGGILNSGLVVTLAGLQITGNQAAEQGGGIESQGSGPLTIVDTEVTGNEAAVGGGLANVADGALLILRSTIAENVAHTTGGGIHNASDKESDLENATVSGNTALVAGGGIYTDADANLGIASTTITGNTAPTGSGIGVPDGFVNFPIVPSTTVLLRNTIVASNLGGPDCDGALGSEGGNVDGGAWCFLSHPTDQAGVDPGLEPLGENGGTTRTHALAATSVAVDRGVGACPAADQRGVARPQGARCDSGAYEHEGPAPPDDVDPDTEITGAPDVSFGGATFSFTGSDDVTAPAKLAFECRVVDAGQEEQAEFGRCTSPWTVTVAPGAHVFEVRAVDAAGNVDETPATHAWTDEEPPPDTTAPETTITAGPPAATTSTGASLAFAADEAGSTFECSLDGAGFAACVSPASYTGLALGAHTFEVRAADAEGNVDETPAAHTWTIEALPACAGGSLTLAAVADSWILVSSPSSNYGGDSVLKVASKLDGDSRGLVRFGAPAIPTGCKLVAAHLRLYDGSHKEGRRLEVRRAETSWTEAGVTWANQPAATGAAVSVAAGPGYLQWTVTALVLEQASAGNFGFVVRDAVEGGDGLEQGFNSREKGRDNPPQLVVTFG